MQRSPDRLGTRENLAELFWEAGQTQEAVAGLEALVQINPEAFEVHRKLSAMYLAMKDVARSIGHCEQIVESGSAEIGDFIRLAELQRFADRLALDEARSFATLINQSIDLGSSITDALRVYSDDMRHKRLSSAEEKAYALPAKLSVPMMVCIFPVLFVVILLPVFVRVHYANF